MKNRADDLDLDVCLRSSDHDVLLCLPQYGSEYQDWFHCVGFSHGDVIPSYIMTKYGRVTLIDSRFALI